MLKLPRFGIADGHGTADLICQLRFWQPCYSAQNKTNAGPCKDCLFPKLIIQSVYLDLSGAKRISQHGIVQNKNSNLTGFGGGPAISSHFLKNRSFCSPSASNSHFPIRVNKKKGIAHAPATGPLSFRKWINRSQGSRLNLAQIWSWFHVTIGFFRRWSLEFVSGVQRPFIQRSFRKDHYFSRDLSSTIPRDYSFNGLWLGVFVCFIFRKTRPFSHKEWCHILMISWFLNHVKGAGIIFTKLKKSKSKGCSPHFKKNWTVTSHNHTLRGLVIYPWFFNLSNWPWKSSKLPAVNGGKGDLFCPLISYHSLVRLYKHDVPAHHPQNATGIIRHKRKKNISKD